jgi:uncharacterized membrane protein
MINPAKPWEWHPKVRKSSELSRGERAADRMKSVFATWWALIAMCAVMVLWMSTGGFGIDQEPFILLNLCLSTLAGLQCFVLLIANKRGEQIAAETAQHTLELTEHIDKLLKENTELTAKVHEQTARIEELHKHVTGLTNHFNLQVGDYEPEQKPPTRKRRPPKGI